jgi:hypothetical protein
MQFEVIDDRPAGAQNGLVLGGVKVGEFPWENFADLLTQELAFLLQPAALDQGLVDRQVTACGVFDKECRFRNVIEQLFNDGQLSGD